MNYSYKDKTFFAKPKDNPKDLIEVEIGDSKVPNTFIPQQKIMRWDNECNVSIRLIEDKDEAKETPIIIEENGKIKHIKSKRECHFYNLGVSAEHPEDASEFEIIEKVKSKNEYIDFSINVKDVEFFRQPPMTEEITPEQIAKGYMATETDIFDENGISVAHRDENIVNSLAVYAKTPKTNYISKEAQDLRIVKDEIARRLAGGAVPNDSIFADDIFAYKTDLELEVKRSMLQNFVDKDTRIFKEYKCGKIGHIPRDKVIDANGNWAWTRPEVILNPDGITGILRVHRPQDFLDKAVYPIKKAAGLTFGYDTLGGTLFAIGADSIIRRIGNPGQDGTATSISFGASLSNSGSQGWGGALYDASDNLLSPQTATGVINSTTKQFWTVNFTNGPAVSNANFRASVVTQYNASIVIYYAVDGGGSAGDSDRLTTGVTYSTFNNPYPAHTDSANKYSVYCTYTAGGGSAIKTINGLAKASVKTVNGLAIASVKTWNGLA